MGGIGTTNAFNAEFKCVDNLQVKDRWSRQALQRGVASFVLRASERLPKFVVKIILYPWSIIVFERFYIVDIAISWVPRVTRCVPSHSVVQHINANPNLLICSLLLGIGDSKVCFTEARNKSCPIICATDRPRWSGHGMGGGTCGPASSQVVPSPEFSTRLFAVDIGPRWRAQCTPQGECIRLRLV